MSQAELETLLRAAPPVAPDRLRARVRGLSAPAARRSFEVRRIALPALAAVALAVVGAAAVHGLLRADRSGPVAVPGQRELLQPVAHGSASTKAAPKGFDSARAPVSP